MTDICGHVLGIFVYLDMTTFLGLTVYINMKSLSFIKLLAVFSLFSSYSDFRTNWQQAVMLNSVLH